MPQPSLGCTDTGHTDTDGTGKREPPIGRNNRTTITLSERGYCLTITYFYAIFFSFFFNFLYHYYCFFVGFFVFFKCMPIWEFGGYKSTWKNCYFFLFCFCCMHRWVSVCTMLYVHDGSKTLALQKWVYLHPGQRWMIHMLGGSHAQGKQELFIVSRDVIWRALCAWT